MMRPVGGPAPRTNMGGGTMMDREAPQASTPHGLMGTFKEGGTVPATGHYKLHAGEKVLTSAQKDQMKNAFGLASATLSHDKAPEPEHKPMKKKLKEIRMKRSHNKGYVLTHKHHAPHDHPEEMHDETHVMANKEEMLKHMAEEHNQPEPPEAEAAEDPGQQQMEAAIGMK